MNLIQSTQIEQVNTCQNQMHTVVKMIMQKKFQVNEIGDYVIGNVLVENQDNIVDAYVNRYGAEIFNQNDKEADQLWLAYFEFFFPPEENIIIKPELFHAIGQSDTRKVHFFFQRMRPKNRSDYKWYFSTSRLCLQEDENVTSILFHYAFELNKSGYSNRSTQEEDYSQKYCTRVMLLSKREKDIIKLIVQGRSSSDISEILYISIHTVNNHRKNIIRKLEINNLCELTKFAILFNIL
ncbi:helix-turn-helix transcriptional regulator [Pedobacter sp. B4-66]|uniref:response regulator transcription factor n=1 Tax=Pedobacter sp. B4-66 TaxID=2817280 RepID=UPI001BDAE55B|nr:helix-turn-helix transcriptional regulator [Pedobacter sp. B4-66]